MNTDETVIRLHKEILKKDRLIKSILNSTSFNSVSYQISSVFLHEEKHMYSILSMYLTQLFKECKKKNVGKEIIPKIIDQVEDIRNLHDSLSDYSKNKKKPEESQLYKCFNYFKVLISQRLEKRKIKLKINIKEEVKYLKIPTFEIQQILFNLLFNSIDALENINREEKTIIISTGTDISYLVINVYDNGIGISPDRIDKVWDPFYTTMKDKTGFGLSIVKNIVQNLNGEISVNSELGKFTNFKIIIPRKGLNNEKLTMD